MNLIVNSWLPIYFDVTLKNKSEEETKKDLIQLEIFLTKFLQKNDTIILLQGGQTQGKFLKMAKALQNYPNGYHRILAFIKLVYLDSSKCKIVDESINLSHEIESLINTNTTYEKDRFLLLTATQIQNDDKIIITTDIRLIKQFKNNTEFKFVHLNQFLEEY